MKIQTLLETAAYNLGHAADEIYKDIIFPFIVKSREGVKYQKDSFDITNYLKPIVKEFGINIFELVLHVRESPKNANQWYESLTDAGRKARILLAVPMDYIRQSYSGKEIKQYMKEYLTHELTHGVDKLRIGKKENYKVDVAGPTYNYVKEPSEFNAFFHQILAAAKAKSKEWNKVYSPSGLTEFIFAIPTLGGTFEAVQTETPDGFKHILKKLIKRLARENKLPRNMTKSF
jgi:hypothetical protein